MREDDYAKLIKEAFPSKLVLIDISKLVNYNKMSRRRQKYSESQSESNQESFQEQSLPGQLSTTNVPKIQRTRRNNVIQRNYQQDFSQNQEAEQSSEEQYIYFKGGRVSKVLAQRKRQGANITERLCKFYNKSYLHTQWLTEKEIKDRNIHMVRQTKRTIQTARKQLQQIQEKYGKQHYFNPAFTRVDRILTTAVLFPVMHHKKGSEMNGKWSQSMVLVCSKILNFVKNNIPYGIIQKDDYHAEDNNQVKEQISKIKIQHVINRLYLDGYKNPEEFWRDVGESIRIMMKESIQNGRQQDAQILKQCIIFLYWQWFCLSREKFLVFLPKEDVYEKLRRQLESQRCQTNFKFHEGLGNFYFEDMLKKNIFIAENYAQKPASQQELLLLHPGIFSYSWLNGPEYQTVFTQTVFFHLNEQDIKRLDLNVETDSLYMIKWCDLDYDEVSWEKQSDLNCIEKIKNFKQYSKVPSKKDRAKVDELKKYHKCLLSSMIEQKAKVPVETLQKYRRELYHLNHSHKEVKQFGGKDIPIYKDYKLLKSFQLQGLNWLIKSWYQNKNCILADEMGLGKTIQTIAFLNYLHMFENVIGPFLVVAPVSTLKQWRNEIEQWSELNCVLYKGKARQKIQQYEFYHKFVTKQGVFIKFQKMPRFQVLLTNYEIFMTDIEKFQKIAFQHIILDEAHKIKNSKSKIAQTLKLLPCPRILLLTGTPIQNNTTQLFGLLNVIEPRRFNSLQQFKQKFGNLKTVQELKELKTTLKPYLMRRVKSDVEKSIPKLAQMLVTLDLTKIQKAFYKGIIEKNKTYLINALSTASINNISLCLRQICNHPYMLSQQAEEEITSMCTTQQQKVEKFISSSSKMIFVHKFLTKCKGTGTKTLIFTQFLNMMSLLKQYCTMFQIPYESLDGSVNYQERQNRIDRFNKTPEVLVFIISTKAGGIGINLTSATNIIIYDSDWNPQNDIQAIARAHRIGQLKNVTVYRLITTQTYEDHLYQSAVKKLGIGLAILDDEYFNNKSIPSAKKEKNREQIEKLLKDGVLGFLKKEQMGDENNIENESIEEIIQKSSTAVDYQTKDCSFSKSKFEHDEKNINIDDPNFWEVALENVESPLQKLVKKLKNDNEIKKIFDDLEEQCKLMIEANDVVFNFVKQKVSMSHFNAQDERELRNFLQKISYARQFHRQYKNIVNDWLEQIEKPSRRFEKKQIQTFLDVIHKQPEPVLATTRPVRNKQKVNNEQKSQQNEQKNATSKPLSSRRKRQIQSSSGEEKIDEQKSQQNRDEGKQKKNGRKSLRPKRNVTKVNYEDIDKSNMDLEEQDVNNKRAPIEKQKTFQQYKQQIFDDSQVYLQSICCFCERKFCSKFCKGRCKRKFHKVCYEKFKQRSEDRPLVSDLQLQQFKMTKQELCNSLAELFECFQCVVGETACFICGVQGSVIPTTWREAPKKPVRFSEDPSSKNEIEYIYERATHKEKQAVFQCRVSQCHKAYHLKCLKDMRKELQFEIYGNREEGYSYPLKCPYHFCSVCSKKLTKTGSSCLRCPVSYHKLCKNQKSQAVYEVDSDWFVCKAHMNDDQIQRRRDEISSLPKMSDTSKKQRMQEKKQEKQMRARLREEQVGKREQQEPATKMDLTVKDANQNDVS